MIENNLDYPANVHRLRSRRLLRNGSLMVERVIAPTNGLGIGNERIIIHLRIVRDIKAVPRMAGGGSFYPHAVDTLLVVCCLSTTKLEILPCNIIGLFLARMYCE